MLLVAASIASACGEGSQAPTAEVVPATTDPGTGPWEPVPRDRVLEECGLDPDLLERADAAIDRPWAAVRYGKLCHEYYPEGEDSPTHLFPAPTPTAAAAPATTCCVALPTGPAASTEMAALAAATARTSATALRQSSTPTAQRGMPAPPTASDLIIATTQCAACRRRAAGSPRCSRRRRRCRGNGPQGHLVCLVEKQKRIVLHTDVKANRKTPLFLKIRRIILFK